MAGAARNRTSVSAGGNPIADRRYSNLPPHVQPTLSSHGRHEQPSPLDEPPRPRDSVSRLSVGLEPMHIRDRAQPESGHQPLDVTAEAGRLGVHVKDAISTMMQLEGLGLHQQNIPLPKVIVLGEQSTGKSSVIESISGIKTPRAAGTCTRCPLFIKLEPFSEPGAKWTARVTLRRGYDYDAKNLKGPGRRYPGWAQRTRPEILNFASTNNPEDLEIIIGRAQMAVINPWAEPKDFLGPSTDHMKSVLDLQFSPNVVCISITHPDLPALSFYDLPGIFGQSDNLSDVKFVRDLVTEYVKDPEALILVTCAMDNDIANSTAGGIARTLKADNRCIGVLTKPDRITAVAGQDKIQEVFIDKRLAFGHGYFVVRNLDQAQLTAGATHQDARRQENHYFENEEPWANAPDEIKSRLGTVKLQSFLSAKLAEQITNRLPTIRAQIEVRLRDTEEQLQQYPEPPKQNALRIIYDVVTDFSKAVRNEIEAEYPCNAWRNSWQGLQKAFFGGLISLKPTMYTSATKDKGVYVATLVSSAATGSGGTLGGSATDAIAVDDSDDDQDGDVSMSGTPNPETPTKKRKLEGTPVSSPLKNQRFTNAVAVGFDFSKQRIKFKLDDVEKYLASTSKSRIPGQIEPRVLDGMMIDAIGKWALPFEGFFDNFSKELRSQVKLLFDKHFKPWESTALYSSALKIVMEMLDLNLHQQRTTMANESLEDEKAGPYIFHSDVYNADKDVVIQGYRAARFKARLNMYKKERQLRTGKEMTAADEVKIRKDQHIMAVLNAEPYAVELDVVAQVTTYYMLAARRFHDSICMRIESKFFKQLRLQLREELENGLGIHDAEEGHRIAIQLLAEQSDRERQRQTLLGQMNALRQGQQVLIDLEKKKYGSEETGADTSGFGAASSSSESFGIPTPQPEEM